MKYLIISIFFICVLNAGEKISARIGSIPDFLEMSVADQDSIVYGMTVSATTLKKDEENLKYLWKINDCKKKLEVRQLRAMLVKKLEAGPKSWTAGLGLAFQATLDDLCEIK